MPTVDIPDKRCIKCGSIRWKINPNTGYKRCTDCANANQRKNYKKESNTIKYYNNPELYKKISRKSQKKYREANRSTCYYKSKEYSTRQREILGDLYIKSILTKHSTNLTFSDVTPELIELKRKQLLLKRQIKNNGKIQKTISSGS